MNILFINGSPNSNGNTAALAKELLQGKEYETLNLTDYRIGSYGQNFEDDELDQVIAKMKQAEVIVIGSPLYWHNICGSVRNILDRFYGLVENGSLSVSYTHLDWQPKINCNFLTSTAKICCLCTVAGAAMSISSETTFGRITHK